MTLQQEYREKYNEGLEAGIEQGMERGKIEGKLEGKIEILYCDFRLTVPEIAQRLGLAEEYVQAVVKEIDRWADCWVNGDVIDGLLEWENKKIKNKISRFAAYFIAHIYQLK